METPTLYQTNTEANNTQGIDIKKGKKNTNHKFHKNLQPLPPGQERIFLGGLPKESMEQELKDLFSPFTPILNVELNRRKNGGQMCLGHGFLTVESEAVGKLLTLETCRYRERNITISKYRTGEELIEYQKAFGMRRIFIKGVPQTMKKVDLRGMFVQFGKITSAYFRNEPGNPEHLGVVIFEESKSAHKAHKAYNDKTVDNVLGIQVIFQFGEIEEPSKKARKAGKKKKANAGKRFVYNPRVHSILPTQKTYGFNRAQRHHYSMNLRMNFGVKGLLSFRKHRRRMIRLDRLKLTREGPVDQGKQQKKPALKQKGLVEEAEE